MSGEQSKQNEQLPQGTVVGGRYVIDAFLARGGFATVYRAHHKQIGRRLAIKVLEKPKRASNAENFRERFLQEAQIAARIEHPGVVDVFDFGVLDDDRTYIAMDLLDGHDLEAEIAMGPLPASRLVPLFIDCLGALAEGHSQGIVHKDLKPSNLFLLKPGTASERLVILDFGIARVFENNRSTELGASRFSREGGFSGTPAYLAPEYITRQLVTPALDVYQMGLILIEALTGLPAFVSDSSMGYLMMHCLEPVTLPASLVDTELGDILNKAVEKEPDSRFQSAAEFRDALERLDRKDLIDTQEMLDANMMRRVRDESASTLQFIDVTRDDLDLINTAESMAPTADFGSRVAASRVGSPSGPIQVAGRQSARAGAPPEHVEVEPEGDDGRNRGIVFVAFAALALLAVGLYAASQQSMQEPSALVDSPSAPIESSSNPVSAAHSNDRQGGDAAGVGVEPASTVDTGRGADMGSAAVGVDVGPDTRDGSPEPKTEPPDAKPSSPSQEPTKSRRDAKPRTRVTAPESAPKSVGDVAADSDDDAATKKANPMLLSP